MKRPLRNIASSAAGLKNARASSLLDNAHAAQPQISPLCSVRRAAVISYAKTSQQKQSLLSARTHSLTISTNILILEDRKRQAFQRFAIYIG